MTPAVLVVDDSLTVRMDLEEAFTAAGLHTTLCGDATSARTALERERFGAIVLDVLLPDADGIEFLKEIRAKPDTAAVPILLLSTEAEVRDRVRGMATGAEDYVGKPYDPVYVVARVEELMREGAAPGPRRTAPLILVVDDSATFRHLMRETLEDVGHQVLLASTGEEGLRLAASARPDAVVVDSALPGIDGATFIRRLRLDAALRGTPCLLLTASEAMNDEVAALEAGADTFVRKTEARSVTCARLGAILRGAAAAPAGALRSLFGPKKVLAVDDSVTFLHALAAGIQADGYDVILATSGEEAIELLRAQSVDCILLDLVMSGLSGQETCRRIKGSPLWRDIPLVIVSILEEPAAMVEALNLGADDYVTKSSSFDVIRARLRAQIRRKQFEDETRRIREELLRREREVIEARAARELAETRGELLSKLERATKELEANALLRAVAEGTTDGIFVKDRWGGYLMINSAGARFLGRAVEEVIGKDDVALFSAQVGQAIMDDDRRIMESCENRTAEETVTIRGTSRTFMTTKGPYRDRAGRVIGVVGIARDITERKRAEEDNAKLYRQATEAIRARDDFLAIASHELRTPLSALVLQLQGLQRSLTLAGAAPALIGKAERAVQHTGRLTSLIESMLDVSRITTGRLKLEREEIDLSAVVFDVSQRFKETAAKAGCRIVLKLGQGVRGCWDKLRMEQVVTNLLSNALKYGAGKPVEVTVEAHDTTGRLLVRDNGIGISHEDVRRIFGRFERAVPTQHYGGLGLGLYITRQVVEGHGGRIDVRSEPGVGSVFTVELPLRLPSAEQQQRM